MRILVDYDYRAITARDHTQLIYRCCFYKHHRTTALTCE